MATVRVFNHHVHRAIYRLALADALLFFLSFYAGAYLYFLLEPGALNNYMDRIPTRAALFSAVAVTSLLAMGLYQPRMREGASGVLLRTIGAFIVVALADRKSTRLNLQSPSGSRMPSSA